MILEESIGLFSEQASLLYTRLRACIATSTSSVAHIYTVVRTQSLTVVSSYSGVEQRLIEMPTLVPGRVGRSS